MTKPKFDIYKKKVRITNPKGNIGKITKYYGLLSKTSMRVPKEKLRNLPRINAAVNPRIPRELVGGIIVHYNPKDATYCEPLNDPAHFGSPSHCSMAWSRTQIAHAVPAGVKKDKLEVIYNNFAYCILFTLSNYVPHRKEITKKAIDFATRFTAQYEKLKDKTEDQYERVNLGYNWEGARSLQLGVFLKSIGMGKLSRAWSGYGVKASGRTAAKKAALARMTELKKAISSANVEIRRNEKKWSENIRQQKRNQLKALKAELMAHTNPLKLICSQMVLLCYQMALESGSGNLILRVDPRWGTPAQVERELVKNKFWRPKLIIDPIGFES
jgi:hypothetical protein